MLFLDGKLTSESIETLSDLRINYILDEISQSTNPETTQYLKDNLYNRPTSKQEILYRQSILKDIEKEDTLKAIKNFCSKIEDTKKLIEQAKNDNFEITKYGKFLDSVLIYIESIETLLGNLSQTNLSSSGLQNFLDYLSTYTQSAYFKKLKIDTLSIKKRISDISFLITIRENRVVVGNLSDEQNLLEDLKQLLDRLNLPKTQSIELEIHESPIISHVEEKILEGVKRLNRELFAELELFYQNNQDFFDENIDQFYRECQFYLSFLNYIKPLENMGLTFCYPEISDKREKIYCKDGFDLALAKQLWKEEKTVVTNDFYLEENESMFLVSGPNQGGKTTFARMLGQIFYLSTLGFKVPGSKAKTFIFDHIYTHFEKEEKVQTETGKLEDELLRAKNILESLTDKSIAIFNEIFSATALEDAYFLAEFLIRKIIEIRATAVFVTFMHKLAQIDKSIVPLTSTVDPKDPSIRTFKIIRQKISGRSYAMYLAEKYCLTYDCLKARLKEK